MKKKPSTRKFFVIIALLVVLSATLLGTTLYNRAKHFGGSATETADGTSNTFMLNGRDYPRIAQLQTELKNEVGKAMQEKLKTTEGKALAGQAVGGNILVSITGEAEDKDHRGWDCWYNLDAGTCS